MHRLVELWRRLTFYFRRRQFDRDLDEEMRFHLEMKAENQVACGTAVDEARRDANRRFGNTTLLKESSREMWGWHWLETLLQDLRYGLRMLRRSPAFTIVAVLSLALGIGANTAIFNVLNAVLLRPLPLAHTEQLVMFSFAFPSEENPYLPYPHFVRFQERNHVLSGLFAITGGGRLNISVNGHAELAQATLATGDYYRVLGVNPLLGRLFNEQDDRPGNPVAVIGYRYWQNRFGGDPAAIGRTVFMNAKPIVIIGVTPPEFFGVSVGDTGDITLPMRMRDQISTGQPEWDQPFSHWLQVMGRLKAGIASQRAETELDGVLRQFQAELIPLAPPGNHESAIRIARELHLKLRPGATGYKSNLRSFAGPLIILSIVVGLVLLIACANIANLLLARATGRQRELAVRLALGAGRSRLIRQLLTESLLVAAIGAVLGLIVAQWGSRLVLVMMASGTEVNLRPDLRVLAFSAAISLATGILFGVYPALQATRVDLSPSKKETSRSGRSKRRVLHRVLIIGQMALSLVLLAGAGLFLRTLQNLWNLNAGYDRENVLKFSVAPGLAGHKAGQFASTYRQLMAKVAAIPGARAATVSYVRPIDEEAYFVGGIHAIDDKEFPENKRIRVAWNAVGPGYFATLGTPLLLGREFGAQDGEKSPKVVLISETLARTAFADKNPIGHRLKSDGPDDFEIVGVVKDLRYGNLRDAPRGVLYLPFFQQDLSMFGDYGATVEVRYTGTLTTLLNQVHQEVQSVDRNLPIFRVKTLAVQTRESLSRESMIAMLLSFFGMLALLLASIGLYGLMSYTVAWRTNEIGIRMALGAQRGSVVWLVMREILLLFLIGAGLGVSAALATARLISSLLFGLKANDPATIATATGFLFAVALFAGYFPARRACLLDPIAALRHE